MTDRYTIQTFDVCMSGNERLRNNQEFILTASIGADSTPDSLAEQWLDDIQACARDDDFDFNAARVVVENFVAAKLRPLWALSKDGNPFALDSGEDDEDDAGALCTAYLFIEDNKEADPRGFAMAAFDADPNGKTAFDLMDAALGDDDADMVDVLANVRKAWPYLRQMTVWQ